jgi:hypothetical protein
MVVVVVVVLLLMVVVLAAVAVLQVAIVVVVVVLMVVVVFFVVVKIMVMVVMVTVIFSKNSLDVKKLNPSDNMTKIQIAGTPFFKNQNAHEAICNYSSRKCYSNMFYSHLPGTYLTEHKTSVPSAYEVSSGKMHWGKLFSGLFSANHHSSHHHINLSLPLRSSVSLSAWSIPESQFLVGISPPT